MTRRRRSPWPRRLLLVAGYLAVAATANMLTHPYVAVAITVLFVTALDYLENREQE